MNDPHRGEQAAPEPLPAYLERMVRRVPPDGTEQYVVPGSTPVISFGKARTATVATVGINPSRIEFAEAGVFLDGAQRRLATLVSLGLVASEEVAGWESGSAAAAACLQQLPSLTGGRVAQVVEDCEHYFTGNPPTFKGNPYWRWFRPLQRLLEEADLPTYLEGGACHLDLVQWATEPVWGGIKKNDKAAADALLSDGVQHLTEQLRQRNLRLVLLNGRQVLDQIEATDIASMRFAGEMIYHENCPPAALYLGHAHEACFVGWSANLQSGFGTSSVDFRRRLAGWIKEHAAACEFRRTPGD